MAIQGVSSITTSDQILMAQPQKTDTKPTTDSQPEGKTTATQESRPSPVKIGSGAKPAPASGVSSPTKSQARIYDKRDLNKDGVVSYEERMKYNLKHPVEARMDQSKTSASQLKQGLSAYQETQGKK